MPDWVFGGNEAAGALALVILPSATVDRDAMASFVRRLGGETRTLRIGAFWGRAMPDDGSPRYLSGRVVTRAPASGDTTEDGPPIGSAGTWVDTLELPPACID